MLVALVAAAMSSIDSVLLVMAATFHRDLVALVRPVGSERTTILATAVYVALFAFVTTLLALNPPGGIVALTSFSGSLYAACFFPVVLFGLYWRKGDGRAAVVSMLVGLAVLLVWKKLALANLHEVFPAMAASIAAYIVAAARADGPPAARRLFERRGQLETRPSATPAAAVSRTAL